MPKKLLMIDDQPSMTRVVALVASQLGFDFRAVNDPGTAIQAFIDYRPDALILDMVMPETDGIEILNQVMVTGIPTLIVLTSGFGEGYLRLAEGIFRFHQGNPDHLFILKKPFRRDAIVELLSTIGVEQV